jgi:hypothetical protein
MCDCPSKRVLVVKDDDEYSSASDFDDDTLTLLAANHAGNDDHPDVTPRVTETLIKVINK